MIVRKEDSRGCRICNNSPEMIGQSIDDRETVLLLVMPAITGYSGRNDDFAVVEVKVLAAVEEYNLTCLQHSVGSAGNVKSDLPFA